LAVTVLAGVAPAFMARRAAGFMDVGDSPIAAVYVMAWVLGRRVQQ
jgi:hypothetical protein